MFSNQKRIPQFKIEDIVNEHQFKELVDIVYDKEAHKVTRVHDQVIFPNIKKIRKKLKNKKLDSVNITYQLLQAIMKTLSIEIEGELNDETIIH